MVKKNIPAPTCWYDCPLSKRIHLIFIVLIISLLSVAAFHGLRTRFVDSMITGVDFVSPQFKEISGGYTSASGNTDLKLLSYRIAIHPHTEYLVQYYIEGLSAPVVLVGCFTAPGWNNNLAQEFTVHLTPWNSPALITRKLQSGDAPTPAYLDLYYAGPASLTITGVRVAPYSALLSATGRRWLFLALLAGLLYAIAAMLHRRRQWLRPILHAQAALERYSSVIWTLGVLVLGMGIFLFPSWRLWFLLLIGAILTCTVASLLSQRPEWQRLTAWVQIQASRYTPTILLGTIMLLAAAFTFRGLLSNRPYILADETHYMLLSKYADNPHALTSNTLGTPLPNLLYFHVFKYALAFYDNYLQAARTINVIIYVLTVFPFFGIARLITSRPLAILTAVVCLLTPANIYTFLFMPETMYFCGFWVFIWCLVRWLPSRPVLAALAGGFILGALSLVKPHALEILPVTAFVFLLMALYNRRATPWKQAVLQVIVLFGGTALSRAALNLAFTGVPNVFSVGGTYSSLVHLTIRGSRGIDNLLYGHVMGIISLYSLPLAVGVMGLLPGTLKPLQRSQEVRTRFLLFFTLLLLGTLITATSKFTVAIVGAGPSETPNRLHGRYYDFALPLLVLCFVAIYPSLRSTCKGIRRAGFIVLCCSAGVLGVVAVRQLSAYLMSFADYPDVSWFQLDGRLPATVAVAVLGVVTIVYGWRLSRSVALYVWCFGAFCLFATASLAYTLTLYERLEPADIAGQTFEAIIPPNQLNSGFVVGTEAGFDLWRLLFYLPSRSGVVVRSKSTVLRTSDLPLNAAWVITFDQIKTDLPATETVHAGCCNLIFLSRGQKIAR